MKDNDKRFGNLRGRRRAGQLCHLDLPRPGGEDAVEGKGKHGSVARTGTDVEIHYDTDDNMSSTIY
jgi:hypothetical protein